LVSSALAGFGKVGNDLNGPDDSLYDKALPQRHQDIQQAKSLLKKAGHSKLTVQLQSSDAATGMLSSALVLSQNAQAAGVTINVVNNPASSYYSQQYMKTPFFMTDWADRFIDPQYGLCLLPGAPYNETQFHSSRFNSLVAQGVRQLNAAKRKELYFEAQKILYEQGGYIIWGFVNLLDGYNKNVHGLHANPGRNLGFYNFNDVTLS
jgi:peptide/nickel transport system substrate-binding protein